MARGHPAVGRTAEGGLEATFADAGLAQGGPDGGDAHVGGRDAVEAPEGVHADAGDGDAAHEPTGRIGGVRMRRSGCGGGHGREGVGDDVVAVGVLVQRHHAELHRLAGGEGGGVALGQAGDDAHALGQLDHAHAIGDLARVTGRRRGHRGPGPQRAGARELDRLGVLGGAVGAGVGAREEGGPAVQAAAAQERGRVGIGEEAVADQ